MSSPHTPDSRISLPADVPDCLRDDTARLLGRYAERCAASGIAPLDDSRLARAFGLSPFIAEYAIRDAAAFAALITANDLALARSRDQYDTAIRATLDGAGDAPTAKRALRLLRAREMVRIAWRDIVDGVAVDTVMAELSDFADAAIAGAVHWLQRQLQPRFGAALGADGSPLELLVLGMGKLGGHELNFSSDIDLIFVYGHGGDTVGGRRSLPHQEYFDRLGRELIALLNETTADGQVFRVDMRLRPFGDGGPLTSSLAAMEHYYAVHGRDWERYALIKARAISGDAATRQQFADIVQPFVFRRYLDYGALDALREMKTLINQEATSEELRGDVKRGAGGIREIEFTGQLFQLTRGGREPRLRDRSIIATLGACSDLGLLEPAAVATLVAAYRFLRVTEHRLQQVRDRQTHALPDDDAGRARLAWAFGHGDWPAFLAELDVHRNATRHLFAQLLEAPEDAADGSAERLRRWRTLWQSAADGAALAAGAEALGHAFSAAGLEVMAELKAERFVARLSRQGQERLDRLMPVLLEAALTRGLSDTSMRRLGELLHAIARRSVYLAFLADHPDAVRRLLELFEASPWIAEQIIAWPLLLDELLDPRALYAPPGRERLHELGRAQVRPPEGLEQAMDQLRAFRNQQVLRVAASDVTGHLPVARVSDQLTFIAETCVERALAMAWGDLQTRFGTPRCGLGADARDAGFVVIGYGKFGGWELGYGSDLDLVFLHDSAGAGQHTSGPREIENDVFFSRLAQRFIHVLSTTTGAGVAYEVDTRLRPSGNAGLMVTAIEAYAEYLLEKAWTWELQALVRARAITGDTALMARFVAVRSAVLAQPRDAARLARDIVDMRTRMRGELDRGSAARFDLKHGTGGITDIEFVVQYAVLRWAAAHPRLLTWTDNLRLLEIIAELGLLPADDCRRLHDAYFAYRADIHRCALQQQEALVEGGKFRDHRDHVIDIWKRVFA